MKEAEAAVSTAAARGEATAAKRRMWWLIGGRLGAAALLLGASAFWTKTIFTHGGEPHSPLGGASAVALVVIGLSLLYALAMRLTKLRHTLQAALQLSLDVLLATWLVSQTGDLHSPYAALYLVIISVSSIFLGARGAQLLAVGCAFCYTGAMLSISLGWLDGSDAASLPIGQAVWSIGLNDVGYLMVGLLAAWLAERQTRSDVRLIEATHALADLRALHERIVESIRSGVVTTDLERRIFTLNAAGEEITGYKAADLRGQDVSILFGDIMGRIAESLDAAARGEASPRHEAECLTAEGFRVRLGYSVSPLFTEGGDRKGLVITFQDLTDVRMMEETSRRQDKLAAVGRVAAGIAHEIRNPLAAMRGSIQVLRSELPPGSDGGELMEIILRESDRLNRIITDFLTYARPRPVTLTEVDLREPLRETFALLRHSPEIRDGHLIEEDLPDERALTLADAASIKQVFWNLARNALNAMPDGGTLRAELRHSPHDRLRITFADTGLGMSPAQVERLFEPFSSSTSGGTGLGLSIVYQIIRDHNGTINVRSREGHGTTITIELRAATAKN